MISGGLWYSILLQVCLYDAFGCTWEMPPTGRSIECIQRDACMFYSLNVIILQLAWVVA